MQFNKKQCIRSSSNWFRVSKVQNSLGFSFGNFVVWAQTYLKESVFRQNPWIIVYVVGGITPGEMKELQVVFKGTVRVVSSDSLHKDGNGRFTTVLLKPLSDQ